MFIIFNHFSDFRRDFSPERPRPHPSERSDSSVGDKKTRIPQRFERKNAGAPTAVRRSRAGQTRAVGYAPTSFRRRRQTRPRLRRDSGLARPARQGQRHARRERARRCSRSRKRTVAFAAAGQNFVKNADGPRKMKEPRCFPQKNATTEKVHADVSQNP